MRSVGKFGFAGALVHRNIGQTVGFLRRRAVAEVVDRRENVLILELLLQLTVHQVTPGDPSENTHRAERAGSILFIPEKEDDGQEDEGGGLYEQADRCI